MTKTKNIKKQGNSDLKKKVVTEKKSTNVKKSTNTVASDEKQNKLNKVKKIRTKTKSLIPNSPNSKHEKWIEHFRSYVKNIKTDDESIRSCINAFLKSDSIPKKTTKFQNYLTGSFKLSNKVQEQVFELVKGAFDSYGGPEIQGNVEKQSGEKVNGKSPASVKIGQKVKEKQETFQKKKKNRKRSASSDGTKAVQTTLKKKKLQKNINKQSSN